MLTRLGIILTSTAFCAATLAAGTASAVDKVQNLVAAQTQTKELLQLMDKDQNGKVSKQEFMDFMSAEFDRLDKDHNGELDPGELKALRVSPGSPHTK